MAHLPLSQLFLLAVTICGLTVFGVLLLLGSLRVKPGPDGPVKRSVIPARRTDA